MTAGLPHFSVYAVLDAIQATLGQYVIGAIAGTHTVSPGDLIVGGVLDIKSPTLVFTITNVTGTGTSAQFTGSVTISAASATITAGPLTGTFGAITGSYVLNGNTAREGTFTLSLSTPALALANFVSASAASIVVSVNDASGTTTTKLGADNAQVTLSAGNGGPALALSGNVGLAVRHADDGSSTTVALKLTGALQLSGLPAVTLTSTGWQAEYDTMGDLSGAGNDIVVNTDTNATPTTVDLNMAGTAGTTLATFASTASTTLTVGSVASVTIGTLTATVGNAEVDLTASGVSLTMGSYVSISGASGSVVVTPAGIAADINATAELHVPGLITSSIQATLEVNTQSVAVSDPIAIPAGPFIAVSATTTSPLTVAGGKLSGTLLFEQQSVGGQTETIVAISNASVTLPGGGSPVMTNGQGVLLISGGGIAGSLLGHRRHLRVPGYSPIRRSRSRSIRRVGRSTRP